MAVYVGFLDHVYIYIYRERERERESECVCSARLDVQNNLSTDTVTAGKLKVIHSVIT
jgi:hypothetical protein